MSLLRGPGRGRAFVRFIGAVGWLLVTYYLANRAAHGFSRGAVFPLLRNLFQIFMLIVGFGYMELAWDRSSEPIRAMGLPSRPGAVREFGMGAALGWGMVTVVLLIVALVGHFYVLLWAAPRAWGLLVVQILTLLAGAIAGEIAFRGYPFQKLVETVGPFAATILAAILFGALRLTTPGSTPTAVWISGVAAILLSAAYLRTHALWLGWGLHFAWTASIGILFGQPLAGSRQVSTVIHTYVDGPTWLTGAEFGPEGSLITLIVLWVGLYFLIRMTSELAWKYSQPEIKPAGIPVDLSHPMHPAPPAAASAPPTEAPKAGLVQIAPANAPGRPESQNPAIETSSPVLPPAKDT
ncbi:MAG TPA: type II CAAX endopeptidase family protein [Acidobacteriaceae bacterium]|nr:type II CAAX endopeptidase family protein [Acidobacteriaceae bacterium]